MSQPNVRNFLAALVLPVAVGLTAVGCSSSSTPPAASQTSQSPSAGSAQPSPTAVADGQLPGCATSKLPLFVVKPGNPGDPSFAIPQPPGWTLGPENSNPGIKAQLGNESIAMVATVEFADETAAFDTPAAALNAALEQAKSKDTFDSQTQGTVCGYPSWTMTTKGSDGIAETAVAFAAGHAGKVFSGVLVVGGNPPDDNATQQKNDILAGFQFGWPDQQP